jgi:hypothetical protein
MVDFIDLLYKKPRKTSLECFYYSDVGCSCSGNL